MLWHAPVSSNTFFRHVLSKEALLANSATIAKNVIKEIEATCPENNPGLENYLTNPIHI